MKTGQPALLRHLHGDAAERDLRWMTRGRCGEVDPDLWFPGKGGDNRPAKRLCGGCEVRVQCLGFALEDGTLTGIWGGTSSLERNRIRRQRQHGSEAAA